MIHAVHSMESLGGSDHEKAFISVWNKVLKSIHQNGAELFPKDILPYKIGWGIGKRKVH